MSVNPLADSIRRFLLRRQWVLARVPVELAREDPGAARMLASLTGDFFRASTLYMIAKEINARGLQGNTAELGVYKGDFASLINGLFPARTLYLFDTFEGFDTEEFASDLRNALARRWQSFAVDETAVLRRMPYPGKVVIRKGHFPETAVGLEDVFVLVSLDADLYTPTIRALEYFYPRLAAGGYILVHDFNQPEYGGARKAVVEFRARTAGATCVPIGDWGGTAVLCRGAGEL